MSVRTPAPLACAALLVSATGVHAQVLDVPGDYPDVQQAIDAAAPGTTIRVHGGTFGSITIDRAITLIGPATFEGSGSGSTWLAPITLAGPGSGLVVLSDVTTGKEFVNGLSLYSSVAPGISGGGFDALHLYDSNVRAPSFCSFAGTPPCLLSGVGLGRPGIQTSVPELLLERTQVAGSRSDNDGYTGYPDGPPGIDAPASVVLAFDSTVLGGPAGNYYAYPSGSCAGLCFDSGGAAVVAAELYHSRSTLSGGAGASWHGRDAESDPYELCTCTGPSGVPSVTGSAPVELRHSLAMPAPPAIGVGVQLTYRGGPAAVLLAAEGIHAPTPVVGLGLFFLAQPITLLGPIGPGPVHVPLPPFAALVGRELAFQVVESRHGITVAGFSTPLRTRLSRPVSGVVR